GANYSGTVAYNYGNVTYYGGAAYGGAIDNNGGGMILSNDTIAANTVVSGTGTYPGFVTQGAGILETGNPTSYIYNTIIAWNNGAADSQALTAVTATGGHDIIRTPGSGTPAVYQYSIADPLLGPL